MCQGVTLICYVVECNIFHADPLLVQLLLEEVIGLVRNKTLSRESFASVFSRIMKTATIQVCYSQYTILFWPIRPRCDLIASASAQKNLIGWHVSGCGARRVPLVNDALKSIVDEYAEQQTAGRLPPIAGRSSWKHFRSPLSDNKRRQAACHCSWQ